MDIWLKTHHEIEEDQLQILRSLCTKRLIRKPIKTDKDIEKVMGKINPITQTGDVFQLSRRWLSAGSAL